MSYEPKCYKRQGGDAIVIASGGHLHKNYTATAIATAGAGTYTAAAIKGGIINRDPAGAARTDTTDTAANLLAATGLDLQNNGDSEMCLVFNAADAAEAITIAGGTGVTVKNAGQTIAQNEAAILLFVRTSATTIDLYILGA